MIKFNGKTKASPSRRQPRAISHGQTNKSESFTDASKSCNLALFNGHSARFSFSEAGDGNIEVQGPFGTEIVSDIDFFQFDDGEFHRDQLVIQPQVADKIKEQDPHDEESDPESTDAEAADPQLKSGLDPENEVGDSSDLNAKQIKQVPVDDQVAIETESATRSQPLGGSSCDELGCSQAVENDVEKADAKTEGEDDSQGNSLEVAAGDFVDLSDFANADDAVRINVTSNRIQVNRKTSTFDECKNLIGTAGNDVYTFPGATRGDQFVIDGNAGRNVIDLSQFDGTDVEVTADQILVDGQVTFRQGKETVCQRIEFQIQISNIASVRLADQEIETSGLVSMAAAQ